MARAARLLLLAVALLSIAAPASIARTSRATVQTTRRQVLQALGVDRVPADYVILVDTSGSMQQENRYARTKQALGSLLTALDPRDHLSLITFDTSPTIRYTQDVGSAPEQAVAELPEQPRGQFTDIGAAVSAGLRELERPDAAAVGTMLLLTDGQHEPPGGSPYPGTTGPSWNAMTNRAQALRRQHHVSAYAIGLGSAGQTDARLLGQVVPAAEVLALPPDQISGYLQRIKVLTSLEKAKSLLASDQDATVTVSWPRDQLTALDLQKEKTNVAVTLRSTMKHVPLELTNLSIVSSGLPGRVDVSPRQVSLAPGGKKTVDIDLSFPRGGGFRVGKRRILRSSQVA
jgi:uncharacterized protein YegL